MKNMKKILALLIAALMIVASMSAFAGDNDGQTPATTTPTYTKEVPSEFKGGTFSQTPEGTITATNVTVGDSVEYYQLLKWDPDNGGWLFTEKVATALTTAGLTPANLYDGITETEATKIANAVGALEKDGVLVADESDGTTFSKSGVDAGMYYLKGVAAANNLSTVYNPAFVSADYYADGNTLSFASTIATTAVLKKSDVPFTKEVNDTQKTDGGTDINDIDFVDTKPGDVIPYKITTKLPSYGTTFVNPQFKIEDTLSSGLALKAEPTVSVAGTELTGEDKTAAYTYTAKDNGAGFVIEFKAAYLTSKNASNPEVIITYEANVTTAATANVTYMDNKAKLTFNQTPTETQNQDDITRHYTFSIDGLLNGGGTTGERTHEIIKVAVDANGNPILNESYSAVTYHETQYTTLAGATYRLLGKANTHTAGVDKSYTTLSDGHIVFNGLEAGEYTLQETQAPAGFVRDTMVYNVVISATYDDDKILQSYTITITDSNDNPYAAGGASFTATNTTENDGTIITTSPESATNPFNNTRGVELPSTGGMGTTILYIGGSILVILAAVLLITKRRMNAED